MTIPYQRVATDVWVQLSGVSFEARAVGVYLLTCGHGNAVGFFRLPAAYAAADLGLEEAKVRSALQELEAAGRIAYDAPTGTVLLLDHWRHDAPDNINQAIHRCELWCTGALPACLPALRARALRQIVAELGGCLDRLNAKSDQKETTKRERVSETIAQMEDEAGRLESELAGTDRDGMPNGSQAVTEPFVNGCEGVRESRARVPSTSTSTSTSSPSPAPGGASAKRRELAVEAKALAEELAACMRRNDPAAKIPANLRSWAMEIDALHRLDTRTWEQIGQVIRWCQADPFWRTNILSATKLRKQFPQLALKMVVPGAAPSTGSAAPPPDVLPPPPPRPARPVAPEATT